MDTISGALAPTKIVKVGSVLAPGGFGLLLRFGLEKELSSNAMKDLCKKSLKSLNDKFSELQETAGGFCGFALPQEPPDKDGVFGGIYLSRSEF